MTTIKLSPATEMHIVCDQNTLFPETNFEFLDDDDNAIDLTAFERIWLTVKEQVGGSETLLWDTDDASITLDIGVYNNEENLQNIVVLGEKTDVQMDIDAKKYVYDWFFKPTGKSKMRMFFGNLIVKPIS